MRQVKLPSTQSMISTAASMAATVMLLRSLARDYIPGELHHYLYSKLSKLLSSLSSQITLVIEEYQGLSHNHLFNAAQLYLAPHTSPNTTRFRVTMPKKDTSISIVMDRNEDITDHFNGAKLTWKLISKNIPSTYIQTPGSRYDSTLKTELRYFELRFHVSHKQMVLSEYLPHVMEKAKEVKEQRKTLKLFTLRDQHVHGRRGDMWQSVNLDHPATFETLAMEAEAKRAVMEDLDRFVGRRDLYRKVGKAWKRGYLLFGPPGTGKSSLIAAMANYLRFDVYDLELTDVRRNSDLRKLLIGTANRSILVVEDIDCSVELHDRLKKQPRPKGPVPYFPGHPFHNPEPQVNLSGFLNFIDGLWSSCGDERIIVFTTNQKDKLDPALLRPGRMDVHIHMSYCTPCGFNMLASNYLGSGITEHPLFAEIEKLIETTKVTPAEVGEQLLKNEDSGIALRSLMQFLLEKKKKGESDESKVSLTTVRVECPETSEIQPMDDKKESLA